MSAADPAYDTASARNGSEAAALNATTPSGGPTNCAAAICALPNRALACRRSAGATSAGSIAWAALTCSVSRVPSRNAHANSIQMLMMSATMATPSAPTMTNRIMSAPIISRRRSVRSAIAPVTSENNSHGNRDAMVTPAISNGSVVRVAANKGNAVMNMPSPVLDTSTEVHTARKSVPILRRRCSWSAPARVIVVRCYRGRDSSCGTSARCPHADAGDSGFDVGAHLRAVIVPWPMPSTVGPLASTGCRLRQVPEE